MTKKHLSPLVSVIIPVYNANGYLPMALDSILKQTYKHLEVIAINDGSTDNSAKILETFAKKDKRLKIITNKKNLNIARSLNKAIKIAKGTYIARMDADDIAISHRIERQIKYLQKHKDVVILGGQCKTIDIDGKVIGRKIFPTTDKDIRDALYYENPIQHPTVIINKNLLPKDFSWYNPDLPPAEDYDLFFRLGKYGKYHNLNKFVLKYRQYIGSSTFKNPVNTFKTTLKVRKLAIKQYDYVPSLKAKLIHRIQKLIVKTLPSFLIYPLYLTLRGIRSPLQQLTDYLATKGYYPNIKTA